MSSATHSPTPSEPSEETIQPTSAATNQCSRAPTPAPTSEAEEPSEPHRCPVHDTVEDCDTIGLGDDQRDEITSKLLPSTVITFLDDSAQLRNNTQGNSNMLPSYFYRTYYETSITLSSRVSKDTHVKHRERKGLKISDGLAFQAVGKVKHARDMTKERIERHLVWNKKQDPSSWISVFNALSHAQRRADFHYEKSHRIGHRVSIAEISTQDLVAATVSGPCRIKWKVYTKVFLGEAVKWKEWDRHVDIPVWISSRAKPEDGSPITLEQLVQSGAEVWVSITELRASNLKGGAQVHGPRRMIMAKGHDYEWLSLGSIPESRILKVYPFDGKILHMTEGPNTVWSRESPEPWIYDFKIQSWRLDPTLFNQAKYPELCPATSASNKRKRSDDGNEGPKSKDHGLDFSIIQTIYASV